ncbi:DNA helicase [Actinomycetota bacterium]|nr:DNA helicase [Actinomycetota bacterium]
MDSLAQNGIVETFEIQELTLPLTLEGRDIIGQAKTGEGKTLAFGVPILNKIWHEDWRKHPQALIILPTRELAAQVVEALEMASARRDDNLKIELLVGGTDMDRQKQNLSEGADIVVGTPGRLKDLVEQGVLHIEHIKHLVLDEADEMLSMGFIDDMEYLISHTGDDHQTMLFSATMPAEIIIISRKYLRNPMRISTLNATVEGATVDNIKNYAYRAHRMDKVNMLAQILQIERKKAIIFIQMKHQVAKVADQLKEMGYNVNELHGNLNQAQRSKFLEKFSSSTDDQSILVTTDVAARGLDIDDVTLVVNYECPDDKASYLHRTGRTGRAGSSGIAVTFVDWEDVRRWNSISQDLGLDLEDPEETYSTSETYKEALGVPADVQERLEELQKHANFTPVERRDSRGSGRSDSRSSNRGDSSRTRSDGRRSGGTNSRDGKSNDRRDGKPWQKRDDKRGKGRDDAKRRPQNGSGKPREERSEAHTHIEEVKLPEPRRRQKGNRQRRVMNG